MELLTS